MPKKVALKVQPRTGFDKSFQNLLTLKCGTLVPLLCDEVIPNTTVSLRAAISASLPPLASDTFMRVQLRTEAFFVPFRLLCGGYQSWQTRQPLGPTTSNQGVASLPAFHTANNASVPSTWFGNGTLSDYLGMKFGGAAMDSRSYSLLPFLAYHRIYDDWYRNPIIQKPLFAPYLSTRTRGIGYVEHIPFVASESPIYNLSTATLRNSLIFPDGTSVFELRQRNFDDDYFTTCKPSPQLGPAQSVSFTVDSQDNGSISIAQIREANSIQQYLERNNILGYRLQDYVKGQYGANLSDGVAQRALYLGSASFDVYSKGIYQTAENVDASTATNNPFQGVGASFGSAHAGGEYGLIKNFTANESGYIFVMVSIVPKVTYGTGTHPMFRRYISSGVDNRGEMANPILQNIGNAPVYARELASDASIDSIFGYTDRYANFMVRNDEVHGLLQESQNLSAFALQRTFATDASDPDSIQISSAFLQIPVNYLDQVSAVASQISDYGCWLDSWLDYKVVQPLARYSIPSLQNPAVEHGDTVVVTDGGSRI